MKDYIIPNAAHDVDDPAHPWPRCYPNTHTTTLASLESQVQEQDKSSTITWVSGGPDTGKSALAGSLCDILQAKGELGASFAFRSTVSDDARRGSVIATIAFQLGVSIPEMQPRLSKALAANPFIFQQSPQIQMEKLVIQPLLECRFDSHFARVIVVDGPDKYGNTTLQCRILTVLGEAAARLDGVLKFIIFTRPLPHITSAFQSEPFKPITAIFDLDNEHATTEEMQIVLQGKIKHIAALHGLSSTFEEGLLNFFASLSTSKNTFIYQNIVLKYVEMSLGCFEGGRRRLMTLVRDLTVIFKLDSIVVVLNSFVSTRVALFAELWSIFFLIDHCV